MRLVLSGESVTLLGERALLWNDLLVVADVHLGKGDHFRARGLPLPPGELNDDLERLAGLLLETGARRLRVLGDLVHGQVKPATIARVSEWRSGIKAKIELVPGNHDRHAPILPPAWGVDLLAPVVMEGPFAFAHEPREVAGAFAWAGHVHPTVAFSGRADRLRFPAFVVMEGVGLLPAFSRFTGGPVVRPGPGVRTFGCVEGGVEEWG
ncbi:phosphoesterase [Deltaproteobacteria bacterium]|nr:phosphoesterase [Deltaproteobacteria bacterium]